MENAGRKLPPMQKQGQIDIEDAVRKGQTAWSNRSNVKCEPFRKIGPAYPAPAVGGALTDFSADDKFVKELAEPIPLGEVTVLTRRHRPTMHLMAQTPSKAFFISFEKSAIDALRGALATWKMTGSR